MWSTGRFMADLWPIYGFLCKRFSLYVKVSLGWALQRSGSTDPLKENGCKFAFKFRLGILLQDAFAPRANQSSQISATFHVQSHRLNLGLNSALRLKDSDTAWDSNYSHSGWETVSFSRCFLSRVLLSTGARDFHLLVSRQRAWWSRFLLALPTWHNFSRKSYLFFYKLIKQVTNNVFKKREAKVS